MSSENRSYPTSVQLNELRRASRALDKAKASEAAAAKILATRQQETKEAAIAYKVIQEKIARTSKSPRSTQIGSTPAEILMRIFMEYARALEPTFENGLPFTSKIPAFTLSAVSRTWRKLVLSEEGRKLWNCIPLTWNKPCPNEFVAHIFKHGGSRTTQFVILPRRSISLEKLKVLSLFPKQLNAISRLTLIFDQPKDLAIFSRDEISLPGLQELFIAVLDLTKPILRTIPTRFYPLMKQISFLSLSNIVTPAVNLPNLTTLMLAAPGQPFTSSDVHHAFTHFENLQHFHLRSGWTPSSDKSVSKPNDPQEVVFPTTLLTLTIDIIDLAGAAAPFCDPIQCPNLTTLSLRCFHIERQIDNLIKEFFYNHLQTFSLTTLEFARNDVGHIGTKGKEIVKRRTKLLVFLPSITTLRFTSTEKMVMEGVLEGMEECLWVLDAPPIFPSLATITFVNCVEIPYQALNAFVRMRNNSSIVWGEGLGRTPIKEIQRVGVFNTIGEDILLALLKQGVKCQNGIWLDV